MLELWEAVADPFDIANYIVEALGCRVGQPLVGEIGDWPQPIPERVDKVYQAALPECPGLNDPLAQGLLQLVGVSGRLEAKVEAVRRRGRCAGPPVLPVAGYGQRPPERPWAWP